MNRFTFRSIFFIFSVIAFVACGSQAPHLEYKGLTAEGALTLLSRSKTQAERAEVIHRVEANRQNGFDWPTFWRGFGLDTYRGLDSDLQRRVLALAKEDCSERGFYEFTVFVLRIGTGIDQATGPGRACARPLSEKVFAKYVERIEHEAPSQRTRQVAELIISQHNLLASPDQTRLLHALTPSAWESLVRDLIILGQGNLAAQLAEIHQKESGGLGFLDRVVVQWLGYPESFAQVLENNSLADVVRLLTIDAGLKQLTADVPAAKWTAVLTRLRDKYVRELNDRELDVESLTQHLEIIHLMEMIPERAAKPPSFAFQLRWMESMLRGLEHAIVRSPDANALMSPLDQDPAIAWLKLRTGHSLSTHDEETIERATPATHLASALTKKIHLKLILNDEKFRTGLNAYCAWLEERGIPVRHTDHFEWSQTDEPGCLKVDAAQTHDDRHPEPSKVPKMTMAFDSVLFTNGQSLNLVTTAFDGSFIDASANDAPPDLAPEPPAEDQDAVTFPILLGLRNSNANVLSGPGTYYFVYHLTWRPSQAGLPASNLARPGFNGGNLSLTVTDPRSMGPRFISFPGPGQRGMPRRPGGRESVSVLDWNKLSRMLIRAHAKDESPAAQPMPLTSPSLRMMQRLMESAERNEEGLVRVYLDLETLFMHLPPAQIAKSRLACPAGATDVTCWNQLARTAADELWGDFARLCPSVDGRRTCSDARADQVLPRLNSVGFVEPAGELGPINSNGRPGLPGSLVMEVAR